MLFFLFGTVKKKYFHVALKKIWFDVIDIFAVYYIYIIFTFLLCYTVLVFYTLYYSNKNSCKICIKREMTPNSRKIESHSYQGPRKMSFGRPLIVTVYNILTLQRNTRRSHESHKLLVRVSSFPSNLFVLDGQSKSKLRIHLNNIL